MTKRRGRRLGCNSSVLLSEDPSATAALEGIFFNTVKCPCCDFCLRKSDIDGQVAHLKREHPRYLDDREREIPETELAFGSKES
ncbi:hypothetical protein GYA54_03505 [Candidatus Kuenenbacteria bacterium]|nr:hypothetical protein [Candidatus Kuenenbacteria bacterium]